MLADECVYKGKLNIDLKEYHRYVFGLRNIQSVLGFVKSLEGKVNLENVSTKIFLKHRNSNRTSSSGRTKTRKHKAVLTTGKTWARHHKDWITESASTGTWNRKKEKSSGQNSIALTAYPVDMGNT